MSQGSIFTAWVSVPWSPDLTQRKQIFNQSLQYSNY